MESENEKECPFLKTYKPTIRTVDEDTVQEISINEQKPKGKLFVRNCFLIIIQQII